MMKCRVFPVAVFLFVSLHALAQSEGVSGEWRGYWTDPSGLVYTAEVTLQTTRGCRTCALKSEGAIHGKIVWTLRNAGSNSSMAGKVGTSATEYVRGEMRGESFLVLNGYEKDDPGKIISLDQYRLALADNEQVIGGITLNSGPWNGQFLIRRVR